MFFYCGGRLQIPRAALARLKFSHRRHSYASGAFSLGVLPEKISLALASYFPTVSRSKKMIDRDLFFRHCITEM